MVCFALWLIATAAFLGTSRAANGNIDFDPSMFGPVTMSCRTVNLNCKSDRVCVDRTLGPVCAIKNGLPCKFEDYCQDGYYCPSSKVCAGGPDGIPEGSPCPDGVGCKPGLYCDRSQKKCLKVEGGTFCSGDSQCKAGCPYPRGCYCYNEKCVPNP